MQKKINKITKSLKADAMIKDTEYSNFEMLCAKVKALQKEVELMQDILNQNNLIFNEEHRAITDIDDESYDVLNDTDWDHPETLITA
jgi:hypothetical protein